MRDRTSHAKALYAVFVFLLVGGAGVVHAVESDPPAALWNCVDVTGGFRRNVHLAWVKLSSGERIRLFLTFQTIRRVDRTIETSWRVPALQSWLVARPGFRVEWQRPGGDIMHFTYPWGTATPAAISQSGWTLKFDGVHYKLAASEGGWNYIYKDQGLVRMISPGGVELFVNGDNGRISSMQQAVSGGLDSLFVARYDRNGRIEYLSLQDANLRFIYEDELLRRVVRSSSGGPESEIMAADYRKLVITRLSIHGRGSEEYGFESASGYGGPLHYSRYQTADVKLTRVNGARIESRLISTGFNVRRFSGGRLLDEWTFNPYTRVLIYSLPSGRAARFTGRDRIPTIDVDAAPLRLAPKPPGKP